MEAPGFLIILLLFSNGGPDLSSRTLRLRVPHQNHEYTSLPEVHPPSDLLPYLPGFVYEECLCDRGVGEDKGSLRVPTKNTLPFCFQYIRKPEP